MAERGSAVRAETGALADRRCEGCLLQRGLSRGNDIDRRRVGISKEWISDHCIDLRLIIFGCCMSFEFLKRFQYSAEALVKIGRFQI